MKRGENNEKNLAEVFGTFCLVLFGTGTAVAFGATMADTLGVAFAFGLVLTIMVYSIGNVSGCHVNPAVSFAMLLDGRMDVAEFAKYVVAQVIGAFLGSGIIYLLNQSSLITGFGANGYDELSAVFLNMTGAIIVEIILTAVFILTILVVTKDEKIHPNQGLIIGFALLLVHILGISFTGTSVNPARSLAPAVFTGGAALSQVWVFIVAPLIGAAVAVGLYKLFYNDEKVPAQDSPVEEVIVEED